VPVDLAALAAGHLHVPDGADPVVAFAADELARYLGRMFGRTPKRRPLVGGGGCRLALASATAAPAAARDLEPGVEHAIHAADATVVLAGAGSRALLAAVYALLADAGCRWSPYGEREEHVPGPADARRDVATVAVRPAFARRAYAADLATWHYTVPERLAARLPGDRAFVDWMAKSGATGLLFIRHANDTAWVLPALAAELARRGLAVEVGGHAIVELLPRALFAQHPEWFPMGPGGRRTDLGNVCASNEAALRAVATAAAAARAALGARDFHLWGLDLFGGGWCACGPCAGLPPSDQALRVANAATGALGDGTVFHLAYHDTIDPPRTVRPDPRVHAEFAPRERCYRHAIDDGACATNRRYREALDRHLAVFEGRVDVFEYYGDAILFGGCALPLAEVIQADLAHYRRAGVRGVSCLVFGAYSSFAYGVNLEAFARAALGPASAAAARGAHCARRYGPAAGAMDRYLAALERVMRPIPTWGDLKRPPAEPAAAARAHDALAGFLAHVPALMELLADAGRVTPNAAVGHEATLLAYTAASLDAVRTTLAVRTGIADATLGERAAATLREATRALQAVDSETAGIWARHDLEVVDAFFASTLGT
jgi:hypothetical protein